MKDKIEEIKKEFNIKINNCFGDKPSGFKLGCYECDSSVDIIDLWEWIEEKLTETTEEFVSGFVDYQRERIFNVFPDLSLEVHGKMSVVLGHLLKEYVSQLTGKGIKE